MRRNNLISLKFKKQPEGTNYRPGHWSWVPEEEAARYLEQDMAEEYHPPEEPEPEPEPTIDIPDDLPGRNHFVESEIYSYDKVKELAEEGELQSVEGIGESTEHKINQYIG